MEEKLINKHPLVHKYLFAVTTLSKLLAMFFFILFPIVAFYMGMQYQQMLNQANINQNIQSNVGNTEAKTVKTTVTPTLSARKTITLTQEVDTSGWKTYTNSYFSFKYPDTWSISKEQTNSLKLSKTEVGSWGDQKINYTITLTFNSEQTKPDETLDQVFKEKYPVVYGQNLQEMLNLWSKKTTLAGSDALYFTKGGVGNYFGYGALTIYKGMNYYIAGDGSSADIKSDEKEFNTILATFKFN